METLLRDRCRLRLSRWKVLRLCLELTALCVCLVELGDNEPSSGDVAPRFEIPKYPAVLEAPSSEVDLVGVDTSSWVKKLVLMSGVSMRGAGRSSSTCAPRARARTCAVEGLRVALRRYSSCSVCFTAATCLCFLPGKWTIVALSVDFLEVYEVRRQGSEQINSNDQGYHHTM